MILLLIGLYRIADVVMGVMANIFYLEKGYEIKDIATFSKFFGLIATIYRWNTWWYVCDEIWNL